MYYQIPWKSKHALLTDHTIREPLVEFRYTGLLVVKISMETTGYETRRSAYRPICKHKKVITAAVEYAK
jgi:hypothetical protein